MDNSKLSKLLSILLFMMIFLVSTIILSIPTATTYEISIYDAFPYYFWILVIASLFCGVIIIFRSFLNINERNNWIFGFLGIFVINFILLLLPIIRNYYLFGRGDVLSHIGHMKNILISGHIGSNMYPILHSLGINTYLISNIGFDRITMIFPALFSLFFIISFYMLFRQVFENKNKVILGMLFASILLLSTIQTLFAPNAEGLLLIPFFLYCYFKSRKSNNKFAFTCITIILAVCMTFLHPLISLILIIMLLIIEFSNSIYPKISSKTNYKIRNPYNLITIIVVVFLMWEAYAYLVVRNALTVFSWLFGDLGKSQIQVYSSAIIYGGPNILDLMVTIFYTYGQWIVITLVSLIAILYLVRNRKEFTFINIFSSIGFLFFLSWSFVTLVSVYIFGFARTYSIAIIIGVFLVLFFIELVLSKNNLVINKKGFKVAILCLMIIPTLFFSTFNLYYSPYIKTPNEQVTASEYIGMETFFENRDDNFYIYEYGISQLRFNYAIYGTADVNNNMSKVNRKKLRYAVNPVDHFGYDNYTSMGMYYNETSYLLINDLGRMLYPKLYPGYNDKWRFTPEDFIKLDNDNNLSLIYNNSNLELYIIKG